MEIKTVFKIVCAEKDQAAYQAAAEMGLSRQHLSRIVRGLLPAGGPAASALYKWSAGRIDLRRDKAA